MADHKITDFVDQSAIDGLAKLKTEMQSVKDTYVHVAQELLKGIKVPIDGLDQLENLIKKLAELQGQAASATQRHAAALDEQNRIVANTTNTISRQLMEQEKLNEKTRDAYTRQKEVKEVLTQAVSSYGDMTKRLAEISISQDKLNERKRHEKRLYDEGMITQEQYTTSLQNIIKKQQALAAEKSQLEAYTRSEAKENANASSSYNAMSQELLRLKKAYRELDEECRSTEIGQKMLAEIKELGAHLKDMDASMGDFHRNVGDYAIACNNGVIVTEDLNRVLGLQAGTIAGCIEQNKALQDAKTKLNTADANYASTLDAINAKIAENNQRISDVSAIMGKSATTIAEAEEQNKLLSEALKLIDVTANGAKEKIAAINVKIAENNKLIQDNSTKSQSIKRDLKEIVLEIANLTIQYQALSEEERNTAEGRALASHIQDLTERAGILKDAISDTNRAISNAASDTRGFDQLSGAIQLAIDGFGLATGAAEMLGISEGELEEIQTKLQAAIAASNAMTKIQNTLQKESAVMQGIVNIQTKAAALAEKMKTAAIGKGIIATKAATIAQKAFNLVAKANPYLLLATGIGTVAGVLWKFIGESREAKKAQEKLNNEFERTKRAINNINDSADFNERIARAAGESEEAIRQMRLEAARAANDLAYINLVKIRNDKNSTKEQYEEAVRLEQETYDKVKSILDDMTVTYIQNLTDQENAEKEAEKRRREAAAREYERLRRSAKSSEEIEINALNFKKTSLSAQLTLAEEFSEEWASIMEDIAKAKYSLELFDIKGQLEKALKEVELSYKVGKISQEQYEETVKALTESANAQILSLNVKLQNNIMSIHEKVAEHEHDLQKERMDSIEKEYANEQVLRDAKYAEDSNALKEKYIKDLELAGTNASKRAEAERKFQNETAELSEKYAIETAQANIDMYQQILDECNLSSEEREEIEKELAKLRNELTEKTLDAELAANERIYNSESELAKKQEENHKRRLERAQEWLRQASEGLNAISSLASAVFDTQIQRIDEHLEATKAAGDKEQEYLSELVEKKVISQEEGEARKRAAEAKTAKKQEELEKKKQELDHKKAIWDKANSIAQSGIATALAVTQALPNIPLVAIVSAIGAIQLATILATPIPKYAKGTDYHKGGPAIVGDGGRAEIVSFGGQMYITPNTPTLVDMPRGAEVVPDADKLIGSLDLIASGAKTSTPNVVVNNDYSGLQREVVGIGNLIKMQTRSQKRMAYHSDYKHFQAIREL